MPQEEDKRLIHTVHFLQFFFFDCQSACVGTSRCLCRDYDWNNGKRRCTAMFPVQLFWAVIENGPTKPDALSQNDA